MNIDDNNYNYTIVNNNTNYEYGILGIAILFCLYECSYNYIVSLFDKNKIKNLSKSKFNKMINVENFCSICWYEYNINEKICILPCNHIFHTKCIIEWSKRKKECPFCRKKYTL